MNKYECGVIRVKSAGQLQTKQISTAGGRASLQSFHPRFICVNPWPPFPNARSRIHPSVRFLFSRSALWHQQRVRFHHLAIHSDAGRIFGGAGSIDRGHRRVGKSVAISLGTGGGPNFDRAPLVFVRTRHICGNIGDSCASSAPSERRPRFDAGCFYFPSCGNIDCASGRRIDGAYRRRKRKRSRRWLVSGGKSRRQWHRRWRGRLARESFLQGNRRRRPSDCDARLGRRDLFCIRRADCFDGDSRRTNADFVARYFIDGALRHSPFHHRARLLARRRRRNEQFVVGGCA